MKKSRYTEEQIIRVLKRTEAWQNARELARELGVSEATLYAWHNKYGGLEVSDARRLRVRQRNAWFVESAVADIASRETFVIAVANGWRVEIGRADIERTAGQAAQLRRMSCEFHSSGSSASSRAAPMAARARSASSS